MVDGDTTQSPALSIKLRDGSDADLWPDRIAAQTGVYPLAQLSAAALVVDPAAPALPNGLPAPAVQLRLIDGRMPVFTPADPPDARRLLDAVFAYRPDLRPAGFPPPPRPAYGYGPYAPPPPPGYAPYGQGYANPNYMPPVPHDPSGERTMAGIAHLSVFFAPVILPLIIWLTQRQSAPYAAKQGKQAFFWHLIFSVGVGLLWGIPYVIFFTRFVSSASSFGPDNPPDPLSFFGPFLAFFGAAALLGLVNVVFSILGAVKGFRGEPFHYPLLGGL